MRKNHAPLTVAPGKSAVKVALWVFAAMFFLFCRRAVAGEASEGSTPLLLTSPAFQAHTIIPKKYSCQGEDINPPLVIEGIPKATKTLALIMDDPDAPMGTWVHWVVYNIAVTPKIEENSIPGEEADNSFNRKRYGGPCPPSGTHRYFFKIYALDSFLQLHPPADKKVLEKAMEGHILDRAELVGLYNKE